MEFRISLFLLLLGTSLASAHKHSKQGGPAEESKIKPRYSDTGRHHSHTYILEPEGEEHYGHHGGKNQNADYVNSEEIVDHGEKEEALGNENLDKSAKDDAYDDHAEREGHQDFQAGGLSFDKHLKDHKADNKETDNVKAHSAGEKFGGEAIKEHKVGKHKDKSKGHKLHGFKNVYHKEEYGDHKTFHDEFLDSDHQHNYDDQHEHKEMQGGKFSKGYKHDGKKKNFDKGDEKHEWRKEEFDAQKDGKHEKGGQSSKHRQGSKKHQGQYESNSQKSKHSARKVKKGNPPPPHIPHAGHHGPHHAQVQPYVSHYNPPSPHHHPEYTQSHYKPEPHPVHHSDDISKEYDNQDGHHSGYHNSDADHHNHGGYHNSDADHSNHGGYHNSDADHNDHGLSHEYAHDDDDHDHYEERLPKKHNHRAAAKEVKDEGRILSQKPEPVKLKQPTPAHYGVPQYAVRQPVFQEQQHRFKPHHFTGPERVSRPFENNNQQQGYRYGFPQARYPFHQSHHHHREQHQPFPRFSHSHHGHHHHGAHNNHFRHMSRNHPHVSQPAVQAQATVHVTKPRDDKIIYSERHN